MSLKTIYKDSYIIFVFGVIGLVTRRIYRHSFLNKTIKGISSLIDRISSFFSTMYESSFIFKLVKKIKLLVKESYIAHWFNKEEREVDVFSTSKIMHKSLNFSANILERFVGFSRFSKIGHLIKELGEVVLKRPIQCICLVVLSGVVSNTIFMLLFQRFTLHGLVIRLLIIVISIFGLLKQI